MNLLSVVPKLTPYECKLVRLLTLAHDNRKRGRPMRDGYVEGATASDIALYKKQIVIEAIKFWIENGDSSFAHEREVLLKKLG